MQKKHNAEKPAQLLHQVAGCGGAATKMDAKKFNLRLLIRDDVAFSHHLVQRCQSGHGQLVFNYRVKLSILSSQLASTFFEQNFKLKNFIEN